MQDQPDQTTLSMRNDPDGLIMSEARDATAIDDPAVRGYNPDTLLLCGSLTMLPTNPEQVNAADPTTAPVPDFRGHWVERSTLLILHLVALIAAGSLTPAEYYFQLGQYTGGLVIFGCFILWWLLFAAKRRRGIALFCSLALGQAGFVALVGLHLQAEDRTSKSIGEEIAAKRLEWASQLNLSRMDPLFEMTSGKRKLSIRGLQELKIRARYGEAQVDLVASDVIRSRADAERRLSAVSARAAQNFRLGVESTKQLYEQEMRLVKEYFTECENLVVLLIDRKGQYSQSPKGLRFNKPEDIQLFNDKIDAIALLRKQLASLQHQLSSD